MAVASVTAAVCAASSARLCDLRDRALFDRLVNIADEGFGA